MRNKLFYELQKSIKEGGKILKSLFPTLRLAQNADSDENKNVKVENRNRKADSCKISF